MSEAERIRVIQEIVAEVLEIEPEMVTPNSRYMEDHGADSLRVVEILSRLEKKFKVVIPQEDLSRMTTLDETMRVLQQSSNGSH